MSLLGSLRTEGFSVRSIFTFVSVVVVTAFLWAIFGGATPVNAAEASWNGEALMYDNRQYTKVGEAQENESHGLPEGSTYYLATEVNSNASSVAARNLMKAYVIYFAPGNSPPNSATTASYLTYDYNASLKVFSNPSTTEQITISPDATSSTSCEIAGVGWFVCPMTTFLAGAMDSIFSIIAGFMEVQPLQAGNKNSGLYVAWDIMRNIANVAFVIAFLIIIYSQLTSVGLSNYGLKKILPRLIIGALLVNLSFIICAVAIDISNILGYSLQDVFVQMRGQVVLQNTNAEMLSWESIAGYIMSGGTAALASGIGIASAIASSGGTIAGAIYILLPALVGLLLAVLVVFLILAARQAIIIIFVVISPLAFVAYLLPNTEKWFNKWREVFMTMLVFFPAFAVVFGGSQLASAIIIQNATSINVVLLGMIVQVAPLVITPLLLKLSGNLLSKIAGLVNNPNKGLVDRTRKWADGNREMHRQRGISGAKRRIDRKGSKNPFKWRLKDGEPIQYNKERLRNRKGLHKAGTAIENVASPRAIAQRKDQRKRNLENRTKLYTAQAENLYLGENKKYEDVHAKTHEAGVEKEIIENRHSTHLNHLTSTSGSRLYKQHLRSETGKRALESSKMDVEIATNKAAQDTSTTVYASQRHLERTKLQLEAEKLKVENVFANITAQAGSDLNVSHLNLEKVKRDNEQSKTNVELMTQKVVNDQSSALHVANTRLERVKGELETQKTVQTAQIAEYKSGEATDVPQAIAEDVESLTEEAIKLAAKTRRTASAQYVQRKAFAEAVSRGDARAEALLEDAGGIDTENGKQRALGDAIQALSGSRKEALENMKTIIKWKNPDADDLLALATGQSAKGVDASHDAMIAASEMIFSSGNGKAIVKAYKEIDWSYPGLSESEGEKLRTTIADTLEANKLIPTILTFSQTHKLRKKQDIFSAQTGETGTDDIFINAINDGTIDAGWIQATFKDYIVEVKDALKRNPDKVTETGYKRLHDTFELLFDESRDEYGKLGGKKDVLREIQALLPPKK